MKLDDQESRHAKIAERRADASLREAVKELEKSGFKRYLLSSFHTDLDHLRIMEKDDLGKVRDILCQVSSGYYKRLRYMNKAFLKKEEFRKWMYEASLEMLRRLLVV